MIKFFRQIRNEKGIAILVALSAVLIMTFLAIEVGYNTSVEMAIGVSQLDRLKAYYLAKSGVSISLLRIKVYKAAMQKFGANLGKDRQLLDLIWSFPFMWPPSAPPDAGSVDKDNLKKTVKKSLIDGVIQANIESEGNKIDLADLVSPAKGLRDAANNQLVQLLQNRIDEEDEWAVDNRGKLRPQEIVNNITDWMDEDTSSLNGGDESSGYGQKDPAHKPPNRIMKTIAELHMVKGITDELYNIIVPKVTLYGMKGVNVNLADAQILRSIDKQLNDQNGKLAQEIITRRGDPDLGPFTNNDDLIGFLKTKGLNTDTFNKTPVVPLFFDSEVNFRIKSRGINGRAQREIFAIVYDFDKVKEQLVAALPTPSPTPTPSGTPPAKPTATPTPTPTPAPKPPGRGPPEIVFWQEY